MKNLDWNLARAFHATVTEGSLSAAARKLGLTQPTLSRQIVALEAMIGAILFERTGRKLRLTASGQQLLGHIRQMHDAANAVMLAATGQAQALSGHVSISVTEAYAAYLMPQILQRLRREAPDLTIELVVTNKLSDLLQREADIAVRHQPQTQSGLVGTPVGTTIAHFYAAEGWLSRHDEQAARLELSQGHIIGFDDLTQTAKHLQSIGLPMKATDFRLVAQNFVALWEMAKHGLGIAMMLREIGDTTPGMVRIWPDLASPKVPVWVVTHREVNTSQRIQLVRRILIEEIQPIVQPAASTA